MPDGTLPAITEIICRIGEIPALAPEQDFYDAGFSSVSALPLLIEMEDKFQVTIPDDRFLNVRTAQDLEKLIVELRNV
jgi:acyl carrier protein